MQPKQPPPPRWCWGLFLVYSVACFLTGLLAGLLTDIGGVLPALLGAGVGVLAARRQWFEMP